MAQDHTVGVNPALENSLWEAQSSVAFRAEMASIVELAEMACDTMESSETRSDFFTKLTQKVQSMEAAEAGQSAATLLHAFDECAKASETPVVHAAALRMLNAMLDFPSIRDDTTKKRILPVLVRSIKEQDFSILCEALSALNVFDPELLQDPAVCAAIAKVLKAGSAATQQAGVEAAASLLVNIITDAALPFRQMASSMCLPALLAALKQHPASVPLHAAASEAVSRLLDATLSALATSPKASLLAAADAAVVICVTCLQSQHGTTIEGVWVEAAQSLPTLLSVNPQQVVTFHTHGGLHLADRLPVLAGRAREDTADALLQALTGPHEAPAAQQCDMAGISAMIDSVTQVLSDASCSAGMEDKASRLLTAASSLLPLVQQQEEEAFAVQEAAQAQSSDAAAADTDAVEELVVAGAGGSSSPADTVAHDVAATSDNDGVSENAGDTGGRFANETEADLSGAVAAAAGSSGSGGDAAAAGPSARDSQAAASAGGQHTNGYHNTSEDKQSAELHDDAVASGRQRTDTSEDWPRVRASSQASISAAQTDVAAAAAAVTTLRQQEHELQHKGDALRSSQRKLQAALGASQEDIQLKEEQLQRLQGRLQGAADAVKAAKAQLLQEKHALTQLQEEAEAARAAADEAEAAVLSAKQDESDALQVAKLGLADDEKELQALEAKRSATLQRIEDTKAQCGMLQDTLQGQVADSKAAVEALKKQRKQLDAEKEDTQGSILQLERALQALREHRTPLQSQVKEASAAVAAEQQGASEAAAEAALKQAATAASALKDAQHAAHMAKTELAAATQDVAALQAQVQAMHGASSKSTQAAAAAQDRLQDQLQSITLERDELRQHITDMGDALNEHTGSHAALSSQLREEKLAAERHQAAAVRAAEEANTARASAAATEAALQALAVAHKQAMTAAEGETVALKAQLIAQRATRAAQAGEEVSHEDIHDDAAASRSAAAAGLRAEALSAELAAVRAEMAAARSSLQDAREQLQASQGREHTLQAALMEARGEGGSSVTDSPSRDMATTGQLRSRISALQRAVNSFKREIQGMKEQLEQACTTSTAHKKRSERFAEAIRAARAEVSALQSASASKDAQLAAARARAAAMEKTVAETDGLAAEAASRLRNTVEQRDMAVSSAERRWFARLREAEMQRMAAEAANQELQSKVREHAPHLLSDAPLLHASGFGGSSDLPSLEAGSSLLMVTQRAQEAEAKVAQLTAEREELATSAMQHVQLAKQFAFAGIQAVQALAQAHARALLLAVEHSRTAAVSKVEAEVASRAASTAAASAQKVAAALVADDNDEGTAVLAAARDELQRLADSHAAAGAHDPQQLLLAASSMVPDWLAPALRSVLQGSAMQDERPEVQAFFAALASTVRAFLGRRCEDLVGGGRHMRVQGAEDGAGTSFEHMFALVEQVLSRAGLDEAIAAAAATQSTNFNITAASAASLSAHSPLSHHATAAPPAARALSAPVVEHLTKAALAALSTAAFAHLQKIAQRKRLLGAGGADGVPVSMFREWLRSRGLCATSPVRAQRKGRLGSFVSACLSYADVDVLLAGVLSSKSSSSKSLLSFVEFAGVLQAVAQRTYDEHFAQAALTRNVWLSSCFFNCQDELAWQTISHFAFVGWQLGPVMQPTFDRVPEHSEDSWVQCLDKAWRDNAALQLGDSVAQTKYKLSATPHALELSQQPFMQLFSCLQSAASLSTPLRAASPGSHTRPAARTSSSRATPGPQQVLPPNPPSRSLPVVARGAELSPPPSPQASPPTPAAGPGAALSAPGEPQAQEAPGFTAAMLLVRKNTHQLKAVFRYYLHAAHRLGLSAASPRQAGATQPVTTVPLALILQFVRDFSVTPDLVDVQVAGTHLAAGFLGGTPPQARAVAALLSSRTSAPKMHAAEPVQGAEVHFGDFMHMLAELACFAADDATEDSVWDVGAEVAAQRASTLLSWMELSPGKQAMHKARGVNCAPFVVS